MTYRDKSILEDPEKMCEYCCNFDKEHIGMDCTALCKLTMTLAYAEDYGGNCMFYNVPKEQIIVPPCKVGETVYCLIQGFENPLKATVNRITVQISGVVLSCSVLGYFGQSYMVTDFGKTVFLTKEEAEKKLKELGKNE